MNARRLCTFYVDRLVLGIAIERVEEVLRDQTITPVPLAHRDVAGLINLRGQIVTAVDARRRLGSSAVDRAIAPTFVVIHSAGEYVSLIVDRAGDVVDVDESRFVDVPVTAGATITALTTGAYKLDGHLLLVLDPDQMLAVAS